MSLCAIVVTFNRLDKLKLAVAHSLAQKELSHLIIIDNASTDGTKKWLESFKDSSRIICHSEKENLGGSGGFAKGIEIAINRTDDDWYVLHDDDSYPYENVYGTFLKLTTQYQFDSAAAAVYYPDDFICEMNRPSFDPFRHKNLLWKILKNLFNPKKKRLAFHVDDLSYNSQIPIKIDSSSFVGFFISRDWLIKMPKIDPNLFIYADDILYTLNLTSLGGKHLFLPTVKFVHDCTTLTNDNKTYFPLWKNYFHFRNSLILYSYCAKKWFVFIFLLKSLKWLSTIRYHKNKKLFLTLWWNAIIDGVKKNTQKNPQTIIKKYEKKNE